MWAAVTGLAAEARLLERRGITAIATAGDARRTRAACERLFAAGADALVSFGIAGALAPGLAPGALLLPHRVVAEDGTAHAVAAEWRARVGRALGAAADERDLLGRSALARSAGEKALLHRRTGAASVDLESHVAAAAAARAGRPFLVLRAVADAADWALPAAAAVGLDEAGRAALGPVLRSLAGEPGQAIALVRLALATRRALRALAAAAAAL